MDNTSKTDRLSSAESPFLDIPEIRDELVIGRFICHGQWFDVWRVSRKQGNERFALKFPREDLRDDPAARLVLENEARTLSLVDSNYVVRLVESNLDSDVPLMIQEWLDGLTLEARLAAQSISPARAIWITRQCVLALIDLEEKGFVHGDLRPANIMLAANGNCKLIGLGYSSPVAQPESRPRSEFLGDAPKYFPPETLHDGEANAIAREVYCLGVTLYRMLTGMFPLETTSMASRISQVGQRPETRLHDLPQGSPPEIADIVNRMLSPNPIRRPTNLRRLAHELIELELCLLRNVA